jgi:hypothetical protein
MESAGHPGDLPPADMTATAFGKEMRRPVMDDAMPRQAVAERNTPGVLPTSGDNALASAMMPLAPPTAVSSPPPALLHMWARSYLIWGGDSSDTSHRRTVASTFGIASTISSQRPTPDGMLPCTTSSLHWLMQLSLRSQSQCQGPTAGKSEFYYSLGDAFNCTSLNGKRRFYYLLGDAVNCTSFDGIFYSLLPPCYRGCPSIPCW